MAFDVSPTGVIGPQYQSPYHGDFFGGDRCIVLPDQSQVTDDLGIVYWIDDLTFLGSLGGGFTDLAAFQDRLVVARGNKLVAYSMLLHRMGEFTTEIESVALAPWADNVVSFFNGPSGLAADDLVFVCGPSGTWERQYVHDRHGIVMSTDGSGEPVEDHVWSSANRKVYYMTDYPTYDLRARTVNTDGTLGQITYGLSDPGTFDEPIRVHPDGSALVSAPGHVYDANDLQTYMGSLANPFLDAVWRSEPTKHPSLKVPGNVTPTPMSRRYS